MSVPDAFQLFLFATTRYLSPQAVAAEWILLTLAALAVILILYRLPLRSPARRFVQFAGRRRASVLLCCLLPIVIRLALLGIMPVPQPSIHDEFSHLLLGDTLAHGRLANPPHPLWRHFESIHILQQPRYASMYPPAEGAFLALGQVFFGVPWVGVLLSVGLMCGAVCWMLQGWFPPAWALFGTLIMVLKICLTGLFIDSYLGGAPSVIGAALVLGALARRRHPLLFGLGLVILMNSRPFEGALLGLLALIYFHRRRFLIPAGLVVAAGFAFAGYYNFRVTGNPLTLPYMLNRNTYGWPENLGFLPPKKLAPLSNPIMEDMRQRELANRIIYTDPRLFFENLDTKFFDNWTFFVGPLLTVPLLVCAQAPKDAHSPLFPCRPACAQSFSDGALSLPSGPCRPSLFRGGAAGHPHSLRLVEAVPACSRPRFLARTALRVSPSRRDERVRARAAAAVHLLGNRFGAPSRCPRRY